MDPVPQNGITQLLQRWSQGDRAAADEILPLVYGELRRIAEGHFRRERPGHTLQATALVHEAWLRLAEESGLQWQSRVQFFGLVAHLIRRILVDHARRQNRLKRGGGAFRVDLEEAMEVAAGRPPELEALDDALERLAAVDPRKARVVELRFFAGLTMEETAESLGVSVETVGREWRRARAWLYQELVPAGALDGR
ncbi:MAG TPA: RNA polymerase subunit sigma-70 [Acidobacteria bacterium]|nr:RNA polymerase subunit sigma-70 [Acidobacteriota bacterium]